MESDTVRDQDHDRFDLQSFLPYLLNQAAEAASRSFQPVYRDGYAMTRTQWRVMANLGRFGPMTARAICDLGHIEKTKVSRAVAGLEADRYVTRKRSPQDGRAEILSLTETGETVYRELGQAAKTFDRALREQLGPDLSAQADGLLRALIDASRRK